MDPTETRMPTQPLYPMHTPRCANDRHGFIHRTGEQTADAKALAAAITSSRSVRGATARNQKAGRLDTRRLARVGVGDTHIFKTQTKPRPINVRVTILLDASSSMASYGRAVTAAQVGRNLAAATDHLPWVTADVAAFTTNPMSEVAYFPLWQTGQPTSDLDVYFEVPMNGTHEGPAVWMAYEEMHARLGPREQGLIIIVGDGESGDAHHLSTIVKACREKGVPVVCVDFTGSATLRRVYGNDNTIVYDQNSRRLAREMAKVIGRVL